MKPEPMQHANALPDSNSPLVKWFDQYGNLATGVVCVAMIVGAITYSYNRTSSTRSENAWASFSQARSAEDFANIADSYDGSEVGGWARLSEGERLLDSGMALMFSDRPAALGDLKRADEAFRKVLSGRANAIARERALWGLAKSTEAKSDGDTTNAVAAFNKLITEFPNSTYKSIAEQRIEALKSDSGKEFYAWFHKQNPKPPDVKKPTDGLPPGHPPIGTDKDDAGDGKPDADKPESNSRSDQSEKTEDKKDAAKDKPAESPTSPDEKSSESKKPDAEEKPKTEAKESEAKDTPAEMK